MWIVTIEPVVDGSDFFGFEIKVDGIVIDKAESWEEAKNLKKKYIHAFTVVSKKYDKPDRRIGLIAVIIAVIVLLIKLLS